MIGDNVCDGFQAEGLSAAERVVYQGAWLLKLVAHAHEHAPAVRRILDGAGVAPGEITTLEALERVPITRKDELLELQRADPPFGGFLGVPPSELRRAFMSPGPLFDPQGPEPDYWRFAPALRAAGFEAGDVVLNACAYQMTPLGMMFDEAARHLGCTVLPSGVGNTELQVTMARGLGATAYCGTPSFLKIILNKAAELGLDPRQDLRIRRAFVAAEMLPESLRREIEGLGLTVRQGYGTADLGCLGYECLGQPPATAPAGMHVPAEAIVEIVDPATGRNVPIGQPGEVVATVNRTTYPLLRFGTGDLSALTDAPCSCGRTSPRLVRIMGRVGDAVKVRGMFVHPRQVGEVIARFPSVVRHQTLVTRTEHRDELVVRIQTGDSSVADLPDRLAEALREVVQLRAEVQVVPPGTISDDAKPLVDQREWD
jgi:phenylacetate-CoA ligase